MTDQLPLIDLSYLLDISGNDVAYVAEVTGIFIDTMVVGLPKLTELVNEGADFELIHKQAHFLKSSAGIIKVRNNYDLLVKVNALSLQKSGLPEIRATVHEISTNFNDAFEELVHLRDKKTEE